jgi:hypothetical protein
VALELTDAIQEPSQRKPYLTRVRDLSWEATAECAFGFPITIDTEVQRIEEDAVIPCCANFQEDIPKSPKSGTIHVSPRVPLSFHVGIHAVFNEQSATVTIQNNTPASKVEEMMGIRWGVQVQFAPHQSLVWAPNKRSEFVSVIPGQRAPMTEALSSQPESELDPHVMRICPTVCDGFSRYPVDLVVKTDPSWDQLVEAWYEKASVTPHWDARKYPKEASAHVMLDANNRPVTSVDGIDRIFAYYKPTAFVAPPTPPPAASAVPETQKKIKTFMTAYPTGDTIEMLPVTKYDEAIIWLGRLVTSLKTGPSRSSNRSGTRLE